MSISGEDPDEDEKVLGSLWCPKTDRFKFHVTLIFRVNRSSVVVVSTLLELRNLPSKIVTLRTMMSNIHRIFDPMGLLIPMLLQSKHLLRATWMV